MQKPIDTLIPNLSKPASLKTGTASDYKPSLKEETSTKEIRNPFSHLLSHLLKKNQGPTQPPKEHPLVEKNADSSVQTQQSQTPETAPSESPLEPASNTPLPAQPALPAQSKLTSIANKLPAKLDDLAREIETDLSNISSEPGLLEASLSEGASTDITDNVSTLSEKANDTTNADTAALPSAMPLMPSAELLLSMQQPLALETVQTSPTNTAADGQSDATLPTSNTSPTNTTTVDTRKPTNPIQPLIPQSSLLNAVQASTLPALSLSNKLENAMDMPKAASIQAAIPNVALPSLSLPANNQQPDKTDNTMAATLTAVPNQPILPSDAFALPAQLSQMLLQAPTGTLIASTQVSITNPLSNSSDPISLPLSHPTKTPSPGWANSGPQSPLPLPEMRLGEDGSLVDKATSPLPVQPTTISTTFTDLQAQLQAMNGTMESVPSTDNAAGKQLLQAPIIPNLINTAGKPAEISVSLSLNLPQAGNPLSNGAKPPAITNTNNNIPTVGMPSTNPLETSNPILQQGMHQLNGFAGLVAEDTDSDDTNNLDSGIDSKTSSALPGPTDTSIDITTSGILPTSTSHQPAGVASGNSVPQFVSAAQQPAEQVADGTIYSVKNGHKELIIRLNPDNLGEVRINLTSHGNQELSARMIASTQESHDLLKGQMDTLKQRLESQGIQIDRLSVVMAGHTESQANTGHGHQQSFQHETFTQQNSAQSQQWTNQDQQPNQGTFAQMQSQFQQKQGMTQPQLQRAFTGNGQAMNVLPEGAQKPDNSGQGNDNGRISILV